MIKEDTVKEGNGEDGLESLEESTLEEREHQASIPSSRRITIHPISENPRFPNHAAPDSRNAIANIFILEPGAISTGDSPFYDHWVRIRSMT